MGRSLFHKLFVSYIVIILVSFSIVGLTISELFTNYYYKAKEQELISKGQAFSTTLSDYIKEGVPLPDMNIIMMAMDRSLDARVFVIDNYGQVIATSTGRNAPRGMALKPEEARHLLCGQVVSSMGFNSRFNQMMISVAVPIKVDEEIIGALVLNSSMLNLAPAVAIVRGLIFYAALVGIILATVIGYYLSKSLSHPLQRMSQITKKMAQGDFTQRIDVHSLDEIGQLAQNFNELAQALDRSISALKLENDKVESILKNMAEGVLAVDNQGRIITANRQAAAALGFKEDDYAGRPLAELTAYPEIAELFDDIFREREAQSAEFKLKGNRIVLAHASLLQENDEVLGAVAVLQDISKMRQLEELRRDFVANVSHELRTPLTSIQAFAEALMDGLITDQETHRKYLKVIHEETLRLKRLISELLDLSSMDSGKLNWRMAPLELKGIILSVLEKLKPQLDEKGIRVQTDLADGLPPVLGNGDRMEQVLINLVHNALQFTPRGGHIAVSESLDGDRIRVSVADNGEGIPEEELPHIWERFHKVDKSRTRGQGGTGLGLSIVKHIIDAHKGHVEVDSELGRGSVFTFYLPVYK